MVRQRLRPLFGLLKLMSIDIQNQIHAGRTVTLDSLPRLQMSSCDRLPQRSGPSLSVCLFKVYIGSGHAGYRHSLSGIKSNPPWFLCRCTRLMPLFRTRQMKTTDPKSCEAQRASDGLLGSLNHQSSFCQHADRFQQGVHHMHQ